MCLDVDWGRRWRCRPFWAPWRSDIGLQGSLVAPVSVFLDPSVEDVSVLISSVLLGLLEHELSSGPPQGVEGCLQILAKLLRPVSKRGFEVSFEGQKPFFFVEHGFGGDQKWSSGGLGELKLGLGGTKSGVVELLGVFADEGVELEEGVEYGVEGFGLEEWGSHRFFPLSPGGFVGVSDDGGVLVDEVRDLVGVDDL